VADQSLDDARPGTRADSCRGSGHGYRDHAGEGLEHLFYGEHLHWGRNAEEVERLQEDLLVDVHQRLLFIRAMAQLAALYIAFAELIVTAAASVDFGPRFDTAGPSAATRQPAHVAGAGRAVGASGPRRRESVEGPDFVEVVVDTALKLISGSQTGDVDGDQVAHAVGRDPHDIDVYYALRTADRRGDIECVAWRGGMGLPAFVRLP
jgi:hypothetical protein